MAMLNANEACSVSVNLNTSSHSNICMFFHLLLPNDFKQFHINFFFLNVYCRFNIAHINSLVLAGRIRLTKLREATAETGPCK